MLRKWICALLVLCLTLGTLTTGVSAAEVTEPTTEPTQAPTEAPTEAPTDVPTEAPTEEPTEPPTEAPTEPELSGSCGAGLTWTMDPDSGTLTISGSGMMDDCTVQPWAAYREQIRRVVVESGVASIGDGAFGKCTALTDVSIPSSVYIMGNNVFSGCTALKSIQIPSGITIIPYGTFSGCTALSSVGIPENILAIERHAFANCTALTKLRFSGHAPNIEADAFYEVKATAVYPGIDTSWMEKRQDYGGAITWEPDTPKDTSGLFGDSFSWILENGTLTITGKGHMRGWDREEEVPWHNVRDKVTSVVMSGKIWSIYPWAFKDMTNLTGITWPEDLNTIYSSAFYNCTGLEKLEIPYSVTEIKDYAFYGCTSLSELKLPSRLKTLGSGAFGSCKALESVELPEGVTEIGKNAFYYSGLQSITLPKGITKLSEGVFRGCSRLEEVTIEGKLTGIGKQCFEDCIRLKSITVPAGLKTVSEKAFADSGLKEIVFQGDMPNFSTGALSGLTVKVFYPKNSSGWTDTRISALENTYTGVRCYVGTPDNFEDPAKETTAPATEPETDPVTEPEESYRATELTEPPAAEQDETAPAAEPEEDDTELPTAPGEDPREPEKPGSGMLLWIMIGSAVAAVGCLALLIWESRRRKARRKRRRQRKPMEWDV